MSSFVLVNGSRATPFLAGPTQRLRLRFTTTSHPQQPPVETTMHQPSFRGIVAALSRKAPRPGLGTAVFGARLLIAFALPSHVFAHEAHPPAQPATAAVLDEAPFLKENDAAMTKMMNNMAIKPSGDIDRDF